MNYEGWEHTCLEVLILGSELNCSQITAPTREISPECMCVYIKLYTYTYVHTQN